MKKLLSFLKYSLLLSASALLMWYALKELDFNRMWAELGNANYLWVGVSLIMALAAYLSRAYRWQMQIKPTGHAPNYKNTYNAMMVGYVANLVLPRMGEVVRCSILKRTDNIPVDKGFGTVIAERFVDMLMLLLAVGIAFLIEFNRIKDFFLGLFSEKYNNLEYMLSSLYWVGVSILVIGAVLLVIWFRYINQLRNNTYLIKISGFIKGVLQGVFSISKLENQFVFWAHTVFVWLMYYGSSLVVFYALPATSDLSFGAAVSILVVGSLGMAAPVQGGVGVYHILVQSTLLLYGIPKEGGMAYALLAHTSQTLLVVFMGVIGFMVSMLHKPVEVEPQPETIIAHELKR
jgi:glycosyltransferase 2 family protein